MAASKITPEQIEAWGKRAMAPLEDGLQWTDLFEIVPIVMEIVEETHTFAGSSGPEKKAAAILVLEYVVDHKDLPWIPDAVVNPYLKKAIPPLIDLFARVAKGEWEIQPENTDRPG